MILCQALIFISKLQFVISCALTGVHQAKEDDANDVQESADPQGSMDQEDGDIHPKEASSEEAMDANSADDNDADSKASNEGDTHPDN